MVGVGGFELPTSCSQSRRATGLRYTPIGIWLRDRDSNQGPNDSQSFALRTELSRNFNFHLFGWLAELPCKPPVEARHFTVLDAPVNRKNTIYYNTLRETSG